MRRAALAVVALLVAVALWARPGAAHGRSVSWSTWTRRGAEIEVRVRVARLDLSANPAFAPATAPPSGPGEAGLAAYLEGQLRVESAAGACEVAPSSYAPLAADDGYLARAWRVRCRSAHGMRIVSDLLVDFLPSHLHFAALGRDGTTVAERVLTADARTWELGDDGTGDAVSTGFSDFVLLGARHVAGGADHLVFLLALLAAAGSLRGLAAVVTGFTVGHSATLALAVLGGVRPDGAAVEALIGVSIAVVAVENVWLERRDPWLSRALVLALCAATGMSLVHASVAPAVLGGVAIFVACYFGVIARSARPAPFRGAIAALFGTVHGFAFSGVLAEMHLPRARLASALFGFNSGVEVAQLAIVAVAWPLWRLVARGDVRSRALELASAAALAAGVFWFVSRAFGG